MGRAGGPLSSLRRSKRRSCSRRATPLSTGPPEHSRLDGPHFASDSRSDEVGRLRDPSNGVETMLGTILPYAMRYPKRVASALCSDPFAVWDKLQDKLAFQREAARPPYRHEADRDWDRKLHGLMGVTWPCGAPSEFWDLWPQVVRTVEAAGIRVGPESFAGFNDGDAALVRALWCLVRHLRPTQVVETGVAHGFTSRLILEALEKNGAGHLSSIDRPPLDHVLQKRVGIAVGSQLSHRWSLIAGSSRRCLPGLLSRLGTIDLFVHDSLHTERNVRFELDTAWEALAKGGALVVDDIDSNWGFDSFTKTHSGYAALVCEAEPIRPDLRRFNKKGLFAVILKQ